MTYGFRFAAVCALLVGSADGALSADAVVQAAASVEATQASAGLRLSVDRWQYQSWRIDGLQVEWRLSPPESRAEFRLKADALYRDDESIGGFAWRCMLDTNSSAANQPGCSGPLTWKGRRLGQLEYRHSESPRLQWKEGVRQLRLGVEKESVELQWRSIAVDLLRPIMAEWWPSLQSLTGSVDGALRWRWQEQVGSGELSVNRLSLDAEAGSVALADVTLQGSVQWHGLEAVKSMQFEAEIAAGEGLWNSLYTAFEPGSRVRLAAQPHPGGVWKWQLGAGDPFGHRLQLSLQSTDTEAWTHWPWQLSLSSPDLASALTRYLESPLATLGWRDTALAGAVELSASGVGDSPLAFSARFDQVSLAATQPPVELDKLQGELHWHSREPGLTSELQWQALSTWGLALGPGRVQLLTDDGDWRLQAPLQMSLHGGRVSLFPFRLDPLQRDIELGLVLQSVSLGPLSTQFGWPALPGTLSADLPVARYGQDQLSIDGDIQVGVFNGQVRLGHLAMERPFGVAPAFAADIELNDLDLGPLTSAFGFGEISGRLDGSIRGLRMLDWAPVAFDARLFSDPDYKGRRRISQRAVQDLSSVGGGIIAGLQQQVLKVFESFAYKQLGLSCRLVNDVCEMGGVEDDGNGYVVVEGAGLPRITVKGFQRRVDWPVLLKRLQRAVERGVVIGEAG
ncbi:hypothetical protein [Pseudomarimonas arenosa]|uniref:Dicarboxylate transport domain-containing protein n=1 Tax=Pseudomarimonas arenosa TaxID=2774145 RepID=A0AAW3ZK30_9GAMM|nr:hypothetical protein [Pseudomarimonas arenosa]MBD8524816.1 hypothetical protein [Pseudomarimonas arenosa]